MKRRISYSIYCTVLSALGVCGTWHLLHPHVHLGMGKWWDDLYRGADTGLPGPEVPFGVVGVPLLLAMVFSFVGVVLCALNCWRPLRSSRWNLVALSLPFGAALMGVISSAFMWHQAGLDVLQLSHVNRSLAYTRWVGLGVRVQAMAFLWASVGFLAYFTANSGEKAFPWNLPDRRALLFGALALFVFVLTYQWIAMGLFGYYCVDHHITYLRYVFLAAFIFFWGVMASTWGMDTADAKRLRGWKPWATRIVLLVGGICALIPGVLLASGNNEDSLAVIVPAGIWLIIGVVGLVLLRRRGKLASLCDPHRGMWMALATAGFIATVISWDVELRSLLPASIGDTPDRSIDVYFVLMLIFAAGAPLFARRVAMDRNSPTAIFGVVAILGAALCLAATISTANGANLLYMKSIGRFWQMSWQDTCCPMDSGSEYFYFHAYTKDLLYLLPVAGLLLGALLFSQTIASWRKWKPILLVCTLALCLLLGVRWMARKQVDQLLEGASRPCFDGKVVQYAAEGWQMPIQDWYNVHYDEWYSPYGGVHMLQMVPDAKLSNGVSLVVLSEGLVVDEMMVAKLPLEKRLLLEEPDHIAVIAPLLNSLTEKMTYLKQIARRNSSKLDAALLCAFHPDTPSGLLAHVVATVQKAGFESIGFVVATPYQKQDICIHYGMVTPPPTLAKDAYPARPFGAVLKEWGQNRESTK